MLLGTSAYLSVYSKEGTRHTIDQRIIFVYRVLVLENKFHKKSASYYSGIIILRTGSEELIWDWLWRRDQGQFFCVILCYLISVWSPVLQQVNATPSQVFSRSGHDMKIVLFILQTITDWCQNGMLLASICRLHRLNYVDCEKMIMFWKSK